MARNARWTAPIMIAVGSVIFDRICMNVEKYFLHFLQCQVLKTPLDLSLTNGQSLLVMKSFPNSCTEVNLVTQLDHSWAKICPTYVQYNTHGIFFTKTLSNLFFTLNSHAVIMFSKSCKGQSRLKPIEKICRELNGALTIIC